MEKQTQPIQHRFVAALEQSNSVSHTMVNEEISIVTKELPSTAGNDIVYKLDPGVHDIHLVVPESKEGVITISEKQYPFNMTHAETTQRILGDLSYRISGAIDASQIEKNSSDDQEGLVWKMRNQSMFVYSIAFGLCLAFFVCSITFYFVWHKTGYSFVSPMNLFFATIAGFGWTATTFTGLLWSRKRENE